ncbi:traC [Symbiodinium microadriaticum]|nr:traC [Symbiodinium microadriaticum]
MKRGTWGTRIVFTKPVVKKKQDADDTESKERHQLLKSYVIFNLDQVDGPFDHLRTTANEQANSFEQFEQADELIASTGADIRQGYQAAYVPSGDYITMPPRESFDSAANYAETAFHELAHWTETPQRLNWDRKGEGYAMGELRAEIAACYIATELGIPHSQRMDKSAAYVQHWLRALKNDHRAIFRASSQASRAADYLLAFVRTDQTELVGNWKRFECFVWYRDDIEDAENWSIIYTHHRDSGLLDQSNASVIETALEPFTEGDDPDVVMESHNHWAVGHIDGFSIRVFHDGQITDAFRKYHELAESMSNYPILDEEDYSNREIEATWENLPLAAIGIKDDFELPSDWAEQVYQWLSDNRCNALESRDDQGGWPDEDDFRAAFDSLGHEEIEGKC